MSQGSLNPKIRFLGQKVFPVACLRTDTQTCTQTDTQNDYCGHPFRVSWFFPSTYHQGSAQKIQKKQNMVLGSFGTNYIFIKGHLGIFVEGPIGS